MGSLTYVRGNLFETDAQIIAHGCNCKGGFGSGVAGQIARLYPHVRKAYLDKFKNSGWTLGEVQFVYIHYNDDRFIANMATQENYGRSGVYVDYQAIETCFRTVFRFAFTNSYKVAIPKVGAGLAGGQWSVIEGIIRTLLVEYDVNVTCYCLSD